MQIKFFNKEKRMLKNFKTYQQAVTAYKECKKVKCESYLKDQLMRASLSVALNLAEGSGKFTVKERRRFFKIALGSCRECQSAVSLLENEDLEIKFDRLGGMIWKLIERPGGMRPGT